MSADREEITVVLRDPSQELGKQIKEAITSAHPVMLTAPAKPKARDLLARWLAYFDKNGSSAGLKEDTQKFLAREDSIKS